MPVGKTSPATVVQHVDEGVGIVRLNRPEVLNAYDVATNEALIAAIRQLEEDPNVGVILIVGAGRAFCAGADVRYTRDLVGAAARHHVLVDLRAKQTVAECRKPVVAAVHGYAVGGGFELALACDIRFATANAVFSFREIKLGTIPGSGGMQRLAAIAGRGNALDLSLSGRDITGAEGAAMGIVNRVIDGNHSDVFDAALVYCRLLARHSPLGMSLIKQAICPTTDLSRQTDTFHALASQVLHEEEPFRSQTSGAGGPVG